MTARRPCEKAARSRHAPHALTQVLALEVLAEALDELAEEITMREIGAGALGQVQANVGAERLGEVGG